MDAHPLTCARRFVRQARSEGWPTPDLACAIHDHCGHSWLRAYRLSHDWTLEELAEQIRSAYSKLNNGERPPLNASRVSKWERGEEDPGRKYVPALCHVFNANPVALGIVAGMRDANEPNNPPGSDLSLPVAMPASRPTGIASTGDPDMPAFNAAIGIGRRSMLLGSVTLGVVGGMPTPIGQTMDALRRQLDETLSATTISDATIDHWLSVAAGYGRTYSIDPPIAFLVNILQDITELRILADQRLPTAQRRGLCQAIARMTGLLATTLVNLNEYREARAWFQTAHRAADESEDPTLRGWILVRHAVSALYWNDPHGALELATQATRITRRLPCVATVWAPAVQARALAQLSPTHADAVREALDRAEQSYAAYSSQLSEQDAYGYTSAQLHFYRSSALTRIGETNAAYEAQNSALAYYGPSAYLDPSLVRLDRATCLAKDNEIEEAAQFAAQTLL